MNKIYRVIWSKTKNCYVVASELAKRHTKSPQSEVVNKIAALTLVGALSFGFAGSAWAAQLEDTYIKIDATQVEDPDNEGAFLPPPPASANAEHAIAIGVNAVADGADHAVAIGENVHITGNGSERQGDYSVGIGYGVTASGVRGVALGKDATIEASHAIGVGTASVAQGMYSTVMGAYSDVSINSAAEYPTGSGDTLQGFGTTVIGSLNSSQTKSNDADKSFISVASSIVGTVNTAADSNGALIFGAGNSITDSYQSVMFDESVMTIDELRAQYKAAVESDDPEYSRAEMAKITAQLQKMVKVSGGQVMAMGGSNTASNAFRSQLVGVGNVLTGNPASVESVDNNKIYKYDTQYDLLDGFENKVSFSKHVSVIGTGNDVKNSNGNVIIGDLHGISGGKNNVIIGSFGDADDEIALQTGFLAKSHTADISDTVMLGYNTDATVSKGVALGSDSIARTGAEVAGYDPATGTASELTSVTWKSKAAAVSVGNNTRQWYQFKNSDIQSIINNQTNRDKLEALGIDTSQPVNKLLAGLDESQLGTLLGYLNNVTTVDASEQPADDATYTYIEKAGSGYTRQITNVAAGREDTDAVNVAQLKAAQTHYYSVNDNGAVLGNYYNDGAIGKYAVASGVNAEAQGLLSTVVGANSIASDSFAEKLTNVQRGLKIAIANPNPDITPATRAGLRTLDGMFKNISSISSAGATVIGSMNSTSSSIENNQEAMDYADALVELLLANKPVGRNIQTAATNFYTSAANSPALFAGITDTIVGSMNETIDDNGSVVYGTGNTIKNSFEKYETSLVFNSNITKFTQLIANNDIEGIKNFIKTTYISNNRGGKGGRSIAIGTNNLIEDARIASLIGTNNKLKGTGQTNSSQKDFYSYSVLDGYGNEAYYTNYATVLGNKNIIGAEGTITENTIVLGDNNKITAGSNNNIVIGTVKKPGTGNNAVSPVGAEGKGNIISIGFNKQLTATNSLGIGTDNTVTGENSIAIGKGHTVAGANSGAFGDPSTIASANSYSVGNNNTIAEDYDNVFALGNSITTVTSNSVFLGDSAAYVQAADTIEEGTTGGLGEVSNATVNGVTYVDFAGATPVGVVSVGAAGSERRIQNVAAGLVSATSTDAINGSQLYAAIDGMQFDIKAGDNITVATETIDGVKTYTISSSNATAVKPGENVAVEGPTETNGAAGTPTGGGTNASVDQGTYKTDNYTVNAADSKVTGFTVESGKPTTSGITTTTDYTITVTSDEQSVVDGKIQSETVDRSVTFTVTDTNTTYTIKADPGEDGSNIVNTYTVTGSDGKDLDPIVDTDTQYELSGEKGETNANQTTPYTLSLKGTDGSENTFKLMDTRNTVEAGDDTIVVESTENEDGSFKYTITSKAKSVSNVEVKAGSDNVIVTSDGDEEKKVYTVDVKTDGEVASGNTGIVTGDTVYKETRVEKDGNYIKKDNTAADNLVALDEKVKDNSTRIDNINNQFGDMDNRMRKGLAGAAALAALHPMDFNPDDKMQFSAGVGHYRGETAAAIGAFYRPDESVMFSIGGTFGNSDNMINAGITFGLDGTRNRITRSRTAMAREIQDLRSLVTQMAARMDRLEGANVETAMFPDVPENHWAYEYVEDLQKRGALKGYPDGLFKGDRAMTRYEFAAMLDRLVRSGVMLDSKIAKEFEPELGRIYVERISGQDNDRKKVERVRVNNSDSKYPEGKTRDVYGSKIVTEVPKAAEAK